MDDSGVGTDEFEAQENERRGQLQTVYTSKQELVTSLRPCYKNSKLNTVDQVLESRGANRGRHLLWGSNTALTMDKTI